MLLEMAEAGTNWNAGDLWALSAKAWGFLLGCACKIGWNNFPFLLQQYPVCIQKKHPQTVNIFSVLSLYECVNFSTLYAS